MYRVEVLDSCCRQVDSDSFVRIGALLKALRDIQHDRLYWGFLDGRAKPIRKGKWKENDWVLCDRYLPYQVESQRAKCGVHISHYGGLNINQSIHVHAEYSFSGEKTSLSSGEA